MRYFNHSYTSKCWKHLINNDLLFFWISNRLPHKDDEIQDTWRSVSVCQTFAGNYHKSVKYTGVV